MPPIPSLTDAFSALAKQAPSLAPAGGLLRTPTNAASPFSIQPKTGAFAMPAPLTNAPKPAIPMMTSAPATPTVPMTSTSSVSKPAIPNIPTATAAPTAAYSPSPVVTMNSGNQYDPNTGAPALPSVDALMAAYKAGGPITAGQATGSPVSATPALPQGAPAPSITSNPLITSPADETANAAYQASLQASPEEISAMTNLNALNTSASQAYTNAEGQPIALPFITGQQAQLQREQSTLATPLEAQLSLAQAKRQLATTASKAALDREDAKLAAARELAKPVSTAYMGTTSRYNPATGQYENIVNPFGSPSGTGATTTGGWNGNPATPPGPTASPTDIMAYLSANGVDTTRYDAAGLVKAIQSGSTAQDIIAGRATASGVKAAATTTATAAPAADKASLTTQQGYLDTVTRSFNTANDTLDALNKFMATNGVNSGSTTPLINDLQNKVKGGLTQPGTIAAFQAQLATLRSEYSQVLAKGGVRSVETDNEAKSLIPDNLAPADLQKVIAQIKIDANNAITDSQGQIDTINKRLQGGSTSSGSASSTDPLGIL